MVMMKRLGFVIASAAALVALIASPVMAEYPPDGVSTPPTEVGPTVLEAPQGVQGLAFTGSSTVVPLVVLAVALFVLGFALVAVSRSFRRNAATN